MKFERFISLVRQYYCPLSTSDYVIVGYYILRYFPHVNEAHRDDLSSLHGSLPFYVLDYLYPNYRLSKPSKAQRKLAESFLETEFGHALDYLRNNGVCLSLKSDANGSVDIIHNIDSMQSANTKRFVQASGTSTEQYKNLFPHLNQKEDVLSIFSSTNPKMELEEFFAKLKSLGVRSKSIGQDNILCYFILSHYFKRDIVNTYDDICFPFEAFSVFHSVSTMEKINLINLLFADGILPKYYTLWIKDILDTNFAKALNDVYEGGCNNLSATKVDFTDCAELEDEYFGNLFEYNNSTQYRSELWLKNTFFYNNEVVKLWGQLMSARYDLSKEVQKIIEEAIDICCGYADETAHTFFHYLSREPNWISGLLNKIYSFGPSFYFTDRNKRYSDDSWYGYSYSSGQTFRTYVRTDYDSINKIWHVYTVPESVGLSVYHFTCAKCQFKLLLALIYTYFCSNRINKRQYLTGFISYLKKIGIGFEKGNTIKRDKETKQYYY